MKAKVFVLLFALMTNVIVTSAAVVEGTCGPNLTWSLNTKDSTLTIEGNGKMTDWGADESVPWHDYISYIAYVSLPEGLINIGNRAFSWFNKMDSIEIPNSVTTIGEDAFRYCNLKYINLGENVKDIQDCAFQYSGLNNVVIPNSVENIGTFAFYESHLTSISIGSGVKTIWGGAFYSYSGSNLNSVYISDLAAWCSIEFKGNDSNPLYYAKNIYLNGELVTDLVIPNEVTYLKKYVFINCKCLTSVVIPSGITSIESKAFDGCDNIVSITWNAINCSDFTIDYQYKNYGPFYTKNNKITSFTFGEEVEHIPANLCYYLFGITAIDIPNSVQSIGNGAFNNCRGLVSVNIPQGITTIEEAVFVSCRSLTTITIPSSVTNIKKSAFADCAISNFVVEAATPPTGGINCGINPANCTLYVPDESLEVYSNTLWWEDFLYIRAIGSTHTITFIDMDGAILSTQTYDEGETIIPPTTPLHEGYTFIGWDTDLTNITSDTTITAQYTINRYRVQFLDWDGTIIKIDSVEYLSNAVPPADPTRTATAKFTFTFAGWSPEVVVVTGDATYIAMYNSTINKYTITFKNDDGSELCADEWDYGTMPYCEEPTKEDDEQYRYTFAGWYPTIVAVMADAAYIATYVATPKTEGIEDMYLKSFTPRKVMNNGQILILRGDKTYTLQGQEVK